MSHASTDRRPEWLRRKHGQTRSEPYLDLLKAAARCTAAGDASHDRSVVIATVAGLDGVEIPISSEDEARNVRNALYRSRPRDEHGGFLVSIPKPDLVQRSDGSWEVRCCVHRKADGDAFIASNPHRKVYDPQARVEAAAAQGPARRRRPSQRATLREQQGTRREFKEALRAAATPGKPASEIPPIPNVPQAPPGICTGCGAPLGDRSGQGLCAGCATNLAVLRLRNKELAAERKRKDAQTTAWLKAARAARKDQPGPADRLRTLLGR